MEKGVNVRMLLSFLLGDEFEVHPGNYENFPSEIKFFPVLL
jgi:hypothetical protein